MKVTLISCHTPNSKRKAGFHWIANSFLKKGWEVNFITGYSLIDKIKNDYRKSLIENKKINSILEYKTNYHHYIAYRKLRPFSLKNKILNTIISPIFSSYKKWYPPSLDESIKGSDLIIFESIPEIMYFNKIKKNNAKSKFIYRVSDDLSTVNTHPLIIKYEEKVSKNFDLVSVPNKGIFDRFQKFCHPKLQKHGLPKYLFDTKQNNPYNKKLINIIFVGSISFDYSYLDICSDIFGSYIFHIIGPIEQKIIKSNIKYYGEMAYEETIKYIQHANVAISPVTNGNLIESNKIIQYTYCKLPIITSSLNNSNSSNIFYYKFGDKTSIKSSMEEAVKFDKRKIENILMRDWDDLVDEFIEIL